jgi:tetratricopeptide (TPR) repeat protein
MARSWQKSEITYLKRYGATKTPEELAKRFETDVKQVTQQLKKLGVETKESTTGVYDDPAVDAFEKAVATLHKGKWKDAAGKFEKIIEETDLPEIAARAQQYLTICQSRLEKDSWDDGGDPFLRAVVLKNQGNLDEALKIATRGPDDDDRYLYLAASIHALKEHGEEAEKALQRAIELNPKNRVYAFHDPDFIHLRGHEEYAELFTRP